MKAVAARVGQAVAGTGGGVPGQSRALSKKILDLPGLLCYPGCSSIDQFHHNKEAQNGGWIEQRRNPSQRGRAGRQAANVHSRIKSAGGEAASADGSGYFIY
jgi:hypothetical protein